MSGSEALAALVRERKTHVAQATILVLAVFLYGNCANQKAAATENAVQGQMCP